MPDLTILYRGPLSSCNYDCHYCPFAKHHETAEELAHDRRCLERFLAWCDEWQGISRLPVPSPPSSGERARVRGPSGETPLSHSGTLSVFFTPWGEALVRTWYQSAIAQLTKMPHIEKVAIQTNLSCRLDWLDDCDRERLGLWCTFHPSQTTKDKFLDQCHRLIDRNIRFSVGAVGLKEDLPEIEALRRELPSHVYLWINAFKRQPSYYTDEDVQRCEAVDPLFHLNNTRHASQGRACRTGSSVISVDGDGTITRCHFVKQPLGNLYEENWEESLAERPCPNETCGCHIGYIHLDHLNLRPVFGDGMLERVPVSMEVQPVR